MSPYSLPPTPDSDQLSNTTSIIDNWGLIYLCDSYVKSWPLNGTAYPPASDFVPIPELSRGDGDLLIVFLLGNGVEYLQETLDPWYRAFMPGDVWHTAGDSANVSNPAAYKPAEAASPLGCFQQYQYCNGDQYHCGPLGGTIDAQVQAGPLFDETEDEVLNLNGGFAPGDSASERFQWFTTILPYNTVDILDTIGQLSSFSLISQQSISSGTMGSLPDNQWQLDVGHWWATSLASLQAAVVNVAVGPSEALQPYVIRPPSSYIQTSVCDNQVSQTSSVERSQTHISHSLPS